MLKIPLFFFPAIIAIIFLVSPAGAQNSNTATRSAGAVKTARELSNAARIGVDPPENSILRGRVFYQDTGRPVKRSSVMFVRGDMGGGPGEMMTLTDGDGNFLVKNVRAGTYYAVINAPGVLSPISYVDFSKLGPRSEGGEREAFEQAFAEFDKIIVDGVNETYVQVAARRGGALSGRVIYENGDPAIGVKVEILRKINGKYTSVISSLTSVMSMFSGGSGGGQTDDRGMYRFSGLPGGEYLVKVSESAQHTDSDANNRGPDPITYLMFGTSSLLNFYFPDATNIKDAQAVNVLVGQEQFEINIAIPDKSLFILAGKVVSRKDKKPMAGAKVSLKKKGQTDSSLFNFIGREMNTVVTDEEGNWKFKEIPKGDYSIDVTPDNSRGEDEDEYSSDYNGSANTPIRSAAPQKPKFARAFKDTTVEDKDVSDVIVEVGYGATVSGTATVENNKEMPSNVSIRALGENDELLGAAAVANYKLAPANSNTGPMPLKAVNEFKLENIPPGKITLKFLVADDNYYVKSARSGMIDLMTAPLEIREGEMLSGVKIVLANDAGTLKGRVLDDKDHPVSGMALLLVPTDEARKRSSNFYRNTRSDADGKFEVKLPPGEYAILFLKAGVADEGQAAFDSWRDEAMKHADKVSISSEGTANITLRKPGQ